MSNVRNFVIIAHIDHGKSTLADRFLELTSSVEKRKMREQFLDQMDLERERGITIKMQPVRMLYRLNGIVQNVKDVQVAQFKQAKRLNNLSGSEFILNLIDTPGHIDFSYEVSRSLAAVEGAVLLVDATQGVQAQTLANVEMAKDVGLVIIPVINKIDLPHARVEEVKKEIVSLLNCREEDIFEISAKTGQGVEVLLEQIIKNVPPPNRGVKDDSRALIFDFEYSEHKGIIAYVRVFDGKIERGDELLFNNVKEKFIVQEVGIFTPILKSTGNLSEGEIGYISTGIKKPELVRVGDTMLSLKSSLSPLPGYKEIKPLVWASIYPESQDDFDVLRASLAKLRLSDSSFSYEEESSLALGRGFKCGFLGLLHIEIIVERIKREFNLDIVVASPTVSYEILFKNGKIEHIYSPSEFPEEHEIMQVKEPWVKIEILTPPDKLGDIISLLKKHEAEIGDTETFGLARLKISARMPLRELMRDFFDKLKSITSGFASLNYEISGAKEANITKIEFLIHNELVPAFSRIVSRAAVERSAREIVEHLAKILPKAMFAFKIQARAGGRIVASRSLSALKKDVTAHLYGGDRTRRMKLWQKQKKGKKRLQQMGSVSIPHDVFVKMIRR